ncbi:MAG: TolC family protein [Ignavibacteriae bacterium]|nr:TolC family protein [Ignavibacteriota bacterium]
MSVRLTALSIALVVAVAVAGAQTRTLTLEEATKIALVRNLNVVQAENNASSSESSVLAAYGRYLPNLSASGSWTRTQMEGPIYTQGVAIPGSNAKQTTGSFSAGLSAGLTLFDGFDREANLNRAQSMSDATEHTLVRTKQSIVFQVESSYLNVLRQEQLVKVSEENLKRDRRQLERIVESNRVGALSLADVYRQQSQVASDELNLINAQNSFDKANADLVALIGLNVADEYRFADATISTTLDSTELIAVRTKYRDLGVLTHTALTARPDLLGAKENLDASESSVTIARSNYFPSLSAAAGLSGNNAEFGRLFDYKTIYWGLRLNWTLFDGFATNQAIQSAAASKRNAEISVAQAERNISVEMKKALLDLDAAMKQYEVSQKGLTSATEDRKIAEERYNLGAGTLLDLLVASAGFVSAEANVVNASYNYVIAKRNVEYVLGERTY